MTATRTNSFASIANSKYPVKINQRKDDVENSLNFTHLPKGGGWFK